MPGRGPEREGGPQRGRLRVGQLVEEVQDRRDQRGEPGEGQIGLGLDAPGLEHPDVVEAGDPVVEQRRGPLTGRTTHHDGGALAGLEERGLRGECCQRAAAVHERGHGSFG